MFVGGLPRSTTDGDFKDYFSQFGEVVDSIVLKDNNGNSKYVEYSSNLTNDMYHSFAFYLKIRDFHHTAL